MSEKTVKINRYYGLRIVSLIYKLLAIVTILLSIGGVGYIGVSALNLPPSWRSQPSVGIELLVPALTLVVGGGLLAFLFFTLSQLIDIQLSMNDKLRQLVKRDDEMLEAMSKLTESNRQMTTALEHQNRFNRLQLEQARQPQQIKRPE